MLSKQFKQVSAAIVTSVMLIGCGNNSDSEGKGAVIADVKGTQVFEATFNDYLKFKRVPGDNADRVAAQLDDYLERLAITQQIQESSYIDQGLAEVEVEEFRKQMLISRYFDAFLKDKVNDTAIENYYNSNATDFQSEKVRVSHILLRTNDSMSESELKALNTQAQEIYSKATSSEDFTKLAEQYSQDSRSAKKGGDLGWIKRGAIDPAFSEAVFALAKGSISHPFKSAYGFHIAKLVEGPVVEKAPFNSVKGDIRYQLRQQAKAAEMKRLLEAVEIVKK